MKRYTVDQETPAKFGFGKNGSATKGVFLPLRLAAGIAGCVVACIIIIPIIVHFAGPRCYQYHGVSQAVVNESQNTVSPPPPVKNIRLQIDLKPVHYHLTLAPFFYGNDSTKFYFAGSVKIFVTAKGNTKGFKLHKNDLKLSWPKVRDITGKELTVSSVEEDIVRQWQSVTMSEALKSGSNYTIEIERFSGPLKPDMHGLYVSSYEESGTMKYLVVSQLEPTDARKAFPCFDEPALKATFDVSLVRRQDFKSISNMESKAVTNVPASDWFTGTSPSEMMVREDFSTTPTMSTYLLAFIVSQFEFNSKSDTKSRRYRTWARPTLVPSTAYANDIVIGVTEYFEHYLNVPYPMTKTDQAAVPDFAAGAMENWGLVIYREVRLLFNRELNKASDQQNTDRIISHEMAHMWFGNLATPLWWDDLWLNEGFASFFQSMGVNHLHPDWQMDAQFVHIRQNTAFDVDSKGASHPIYVEVSSPDEINSIFDSITYSKGSTVLRMMYNSLGDEVFRIGVSNYLKNNSYSNTFHTELYQSLTQQASASGNNLDVGEVMDRWIKQMGYPVVNCSRHNDQLSLSQQHFLSDPSQTPDPKYPSPFGYTWIIPITMVTRDNVSSWNGSEVSHLVHWMRDKSQAFYINTSSWYLLNVRSTGFYRVNYDESNWNALISQLLTNHSVFTPHDRARMLDDSFSLASAGYISYRIPLEMTKYLKNETHLVPWKSALSKLNYLHSMLHRQSPEYGPFSAYMRSLLAPIYQRVGIQLRSSDSHLTRLTRELIVSSACRFDLRDCKSDAGNLFQSFISSGLSQRIEPDIRRTVMCEGIAASDSTVWDQVFSRLETETHPGIQNDILKALSCSREPWLLNRYLEFTLDDGKIRRQDAPTVISSVSWNPIGLPIVWDYLRSNWAVIMKRQSGLFSLARYINTLGGFNSQVRLHEIEAFRAENADSLGAATRAMDMALEYVRINLRWMETHLVSLSTLLDKFMEANA